MGMRGFDSDSKQTAIKGIQKEKERKKDHKMSVMEQKALKSVGDREFQVYKREGNRIGACAEACTGQCKRACH